MKTTKILYWVITGVFALMMTYSGFLYLTSEELKQAFGHLGFPQYFRIELGIAKLAGGVALLAPLPSRLKEWVYAGFTINLISAFIAHVSLGDPASVFVMPLIFLVVLMGSYYLYHRREVAEARVVSAS
jgi:uncharacterized membrane protein YphA (DoxX/SURF4 family)